MNYLDTIVARQKQGIAVGIPSICSAHPTVLQSAVQLARQAWAPLLVEATCNQVNQFGGYTGMRPADFAQFVSEIARRYGLPSEQLILGGDHLGPNPWQKLPAEAAMQNAEQMVAAYIRAGFEKIHLDASIKLASDPLDQPLDAEISAARCARLALAAEKACADGQKPRYVIGTEVPVPGGAKEHEESVSVTRPEDVCQTIELTRQAFEQVGLQDAWERVMAVVVQPGVEFGSDFVLEYDHQKTRQLSSLIMSQPHMVYEAHSTDYQTGSALKQLVEDHFAILKVGPGLTYAYREAVFALAHIEEQIILDGEQSHILAVIEAAMLENPRDWQPYYPGNGQGLATARKYSLSDRIRYYWPRPQVQAALEILRKNLSDHATPLTLLSQFLPVQYGIVRAGTLANRPDEIIQDKVDEVLREYSLACNLV